MDWYDRGDPTGRPLHIRAGVHLEIEEDSAAVQTFGDYFNDYRLHADAKMRGPDGDRCHPWTRGVLRPAVVTAGRIIRVGKESNPLTDSTNIDEGIAFEYSEPVCRCGRHLTGRQKWCSDACRKRDARRRSNS
jgi:hypothetical protein